MNIKTSSSQGGAPPYALVLYYSSDILELIGQFLYLCYLCIIQSYYLQALCKQELAKWQTIIKSEFKNKIDVLMPTGATNLSLAYDTASDMLQKAGEFN